MKYCIRKDSFQVFPASDSYFYIAKETGLLIENAKDFLDLALFDNEKEANAFLKKLQESNTYYFDFYVYGLTWIN